MTKDSSQELAARYLLLAEEMLADAKFNLDSGRLRTALDRAYYAMYHAGTAALITAGGQVPASHRGLRNAFGRYLVKMGTIEQQFSRDLTLMLDTRLENAYEPLMEPDVGDVSRKMAAAERFVDRMRVYVEGAIK